MPSTEVVTFWLDMGAPISLLSGICRHACSPDCRTRGQARPWILRGVRTMAPMSAPPLVLTRARVPMHKLQLAWLALVSLMVVACSPGGSLPSPAPSVASPSATARTVLVGRLAAIASAIDRWGAAADLAEARRAAEAARNLVVGPAGPYYGDADGDGTIEGASPIGLLPGLSGEPGIAVPADGTCVERDVLGGSWSDPADRWGRLDEAIDAWSPVNNPFPTLPSHPQRIVGWATLALETPEIADAHEYAGHAHLHVDIASAAASGCTE